MNNRLILVMPVCLVAFGMCEAMNGLLGPQQSGAVKILYHAQSGRDGHMLNLEITENDIREFLCLKKAEKNTEKKVASVPESTSDNKTVKTRAGKTVKYYRSGYKAKNKDCFFKFDLCSK